MNRSPLVWIALPLAVTLGAVVGVVATQKMMTRPRPLALAIAEPPQPPPVVLPTPGDRSPFNVDDPPPIPAGQPPIPTPPARPGKRLPFDIKESDPEPPAGTAKEPEPPTEPEMPGMSEIPEFNPPPGYFDLPAPNKNDGTDPPIIKNGQVLTIEVLEALPGRPINGARVVRPDGTISLGFYGDLRVAGLNRYQAKVKLIEQMRKYLNDEVLGLWSLPALHDKYVSVPPVESNRVFVDESANFFPGGVENTPVPAAKAGFVNDSPATKAELDQLRLELIKLRKELDDLREEHKSPKADPPVAASKPG